MTQLKRVSHKYCPPFCSDNDPCMLWPKRKYCCVFIPYPPPKMPSTISIICQHSAVHTHAIVKQWKGLWLVELSFVAIQRVSLFKLRLIYAVEIFVDGWARVCIAVDIVANCACLALFEFVDITQGGVALVLVIRVTICQKRRDGGGVDDCYWQGVMQ